MNRCLKVLASWRTFPIFGGKNTSLDHFLRQCPPKRMFPVARRISGMSEETKDETASSSHSVKTDSTASSFELVQSDELPLSVHSSFEHVNPDDIPRWESISNLRQIDFKKECPDQLNMSFAGCGFLGIYHLGVAKALQTHGRELLERVDMFGGASAGALVATLLALKTRDDHIIQECVDWCLDTARVVHKHRGGLFNPSVCLMSALTDFLQTQVPDDAHRTASGRVFMSITDKSRNQNVIVSEYESKEDLIQCMLASSYVPHITGKTTVKWKGKKFVDGGLTNNLPILARGRTISVTPFSGSNKDIAPAERSKTDWHVTINQENYLVSRSNIVRGLHAFFPPKVKHLKSYYARGERDAIRFLMREGMYRDGGERPVQSERQHDKTVSSEEAAPTPTSFRNSAEYETTV